MDFVDWEASKKLAKPFTQEESPMSNKAPIMIRKKTFKEGDSLKAVILYDAQSNSRDAVLLDQDGHIVGFETDRVYKPCGGAKEIAKSGLVIGSEYYGYDCRNTHNDVYMLQPTEV